MGEIEAEPTKSIVSNVLEDLKWANAVVQLMTNSIEHGEALPEGATRLMLDVEETLADVKYGVEELGRRAQENAKATEEQTGEERDEKE